MRPWCGNYGLLSLHVIRIIFNLLGCYVDCACNVAYTEEIAGVKHYAKILAVEITPSEIAEHLERRSKELDIIPVLDRRY